MNTPPKLLEDCRTFFADSIDPFILMDQNFQVIWCNRAFLNTFGFAAEAPDGADFSGLMGCPDSIFDLTEIMRRLQLGEPVRMRTLLRSATGEPVHVDCGGHALPRSASAGNDPRYMLIVRDISAMSMAMEALEANGNNTYRKLFENAVEGIFRTTPEGRYLDANPALARIYGYSSPQELIQHFSNIASQLYVDEGRRDQFQEIMRKHGEVWEFESRIYRKNGEIIWISENSWIVRNSMGDIDCYEGTVTNITRRKETESELELQRARFTKLFENSPQAIVLIDTKGFITDVNRGFEELFGYGHQEVVGKRNREVVVPKELRFEAEQFYQNLSKGLHIQKETIRLHRSGRQIPVSVLGYPIRIGGEITGLYYIYADITERREFQDQLAHQAFHDSLTGLPNRALFMERLGRAVARAKRRENYRFAVFMLDLNRFKVVNDSLGHQAGDKLLIGVSRRIQSCIRSVDSVARLGGDEFAVLLEEYNVLQDVAEIAKRIHEVMKAPFVLGDQKIVTQASIGIVLKTEHYDNAEAILRDADIAMYRAKERGRIHSVRFKVFNKKMHLQATENLQIENDLRIAVYEGQMVLHYQPIVTVHDQALTGFEALVRWNHPRLGIVPPARFIPIAEETGLIIPLGAWVLEESCRQMREWRAELEDTGQLTMSVNISSKQLAQPDLVSFVKGVLERNSLSPQCLKLELTESVFLQDAPRATETLRSLKELGVQIVVDDFGTGYSSLNYLKLMPVDTLKIDRGFISGQDNCQQNLEIVRSIISLARNLGLQVIAEGVENEEQLRNLINQQCDAAQGFMFSKPVDNYKATQLIKKLSR